MDKRTFNRLGEITVIKVFVKEINNESPITV